MSADNDESAAADTSGWLTLTEAADVAGVSRKTVRRAVSSGTVRGERAGGAENAPWLVRLEDVQARWGGGAGRSDTAAPLALEETATEPDDADTTATRKPRVGERPSVLRRRLVVAETERRWWQLKNR